MVPPRLPDGLTVGIEAQLIDHYFNRNPRHVSGSTRRYQRSVLKTILVHHAVVRQVSLQSAHTSLDPPDLVFWQPEELFTKDLHEDVGPCVVERSQVDWPVLLVVYFSDPVLLSVGIFTAIVLSLSLDRKRARLVGPLGMLHLISLFDGCIGPDDRLRFLEGLRILMGYVPKEVSMRPGRDETVKFHLFYEPGNPFDFHCKALQELSWVLSLSLLDVGEMPRLLLFPAAENVLNRKRSVSPWKLRIEFAGSR
ncbi:hypothetical protein Nepgr_016684 [Nepenthes gracilis]|uniref:Uncharacterized protein n=1 Tax=Nepenthes gracilis TaxID=150966 RepID=A0AAD3SP12_NEPGR|nr:hypothetical protein Nepgr_016684 [Nepenthes gracilis]